MPGKAGIVGASSDHSDDSIRPDNVPLVFYPAYCYKASPTWFTWVKLTAYDIHNHLQARIEYQTVPNFVDAGDRWAQNQPLLLFYLNHPIQFVQLVGVVVTFEDYFDKFWLFTLDDSSGATVEVNCRKPEKHTNDDHKGVPTEKEKDKEADARFVAMSKLDIGAIVQIKGQINTFRNVRQLQLERILFVHDTNHEMQLIAARTEYYQRILCSPWTLSLNRQKSLQRQALGESEGQKEHIRRRQRLLQMKLDREKRHLDKIAKEYEREDRERRKGADEARHAGQLLKGVH